MKKLLLVIFLTLSTNMIFSQIIFEKAYYIDNQGEKNEGFIKNLDWRSNPTSFEYKTSADSEISILNINQVKEFSIYNKSKFIRETVKIDRSTDNLQKLSYNKQPDFKEEILFLKVIVEGKASLYEYLDDSARRYFFNVEKDNIEQLIYKRYLDPNAGNNFLVNNSYQQQLFNALRCNTLQMKNFEKTDYNKRDLSKIFIEYNECENEEVTEYGKSIERDFFHLTIRPGISNSSLSVEHGFQFYRDVEFDNTYSFRIGIEAEFILPFNKNKWALIVEPTYQSISGEGNTTTINPTFGQLTANYDYKAIELPFGLRHYFFLNENSKLFINAGYMVNFGFDSTFNYEPSNVIMNSELEINKTKNNGVFGLGYKYNDRYSIEFRYLTPRDVFRNYSAYTSNYKSFSIIFGYSIF